MDPAVQMDRYEYTLETFATGCGAVVKKGCSHSYVVAATAMEETSAAPVAVVVGFCELGQERSVQEVMVVFHCSCYSAAVVVAEANT